MTRVLIVDDNSLDRMVHRRWLETVGGIAVDEAETADAALEATAGTPFDCILMDFVMPGGNGLHALRLLRATLPDCPPIILLSCAMTEDIKRNALALGASACFAKPLQDGGSLVAAIHRAIAEKDKRINALTASV